MKTGIKLNKQIARKVLETVDAGLVRGTGSPEPGKMCVEAAVCYALGLPHGDEPPCVGSAVRAFKIKLNDCPWPSIEARAKGMRELAIAQLGSDTLDQMEFGKLMLLRGTQTLLPFVWRKEAERNNNWAHKTKMLEFCDKMETVRTFEEARTITRSAFAFAYNYASVSFAFAYNYASAFDFAYACASAFAYAFAHDYASACFNHELLQLTAKVGVEVLKEMKSPGCKWLDLCKEAK